MHRHGYKGRKFGRETDQRLALTRGLICSLIKYQTITTTLARAKEIRRMTEKLVTLAKKNTLASRRLVIARLNDLEAASILFDVIAPQSKRNSGYLRIERAGYRRGDNSEMGTISFVEECDFTAPVKEEKAKKADVKAKADKNSKKEAK